MQNVNCTLTWEGYIRGFLQIIRWLFGEKDVGLLMVASPFLRRGNGAIGKVSLLVCLLNPHPCLRIFEERKDKKIKNN